MEAALSTLALQELSGDDSWARPYIRPERRETLLRWPAGPVASRTLSASRLDSDLLSVFQRIGRIYDNAVVWIQTTEKLYGVSEIAANHHGLKLDLLIWSYYCYARPLSTKQKSIYRNCDTNSLNG